MCFCFSLDGIISGLSGLIHEDNKVSKNTQSVPENRIITKILRRRLRVNERACMYVRVRDTRVARE